MSDLRLIHSSVSSEESARTLAGKLVENDLAACVSIGSKIRSVYRWEGTLEDEEELPLTVKTTTNRLEETMEFLEQNHPYDCPELIVTAPFATNENYENWAKTQLD